MTKENEMDGEDSSSGSMKMCQDLIKKVDGFIKKGGASVDELDEIKMDLEDMMSEDYGETEDDSMESEKPSGGMHGLIIRIQNRGKGD